MSPELLHTEVYIAVDSAIGDAIDAKYGHRLPSASPKISQVTAVPRVLKFKLLSLNKRRV